MNKRLVDVQQQLEAQELHAKIAAVESEWGDEPEILDFLAQTVTELEKQASAGAFGPNGLTTSQLLSLGVRYTAEALEELEKEAEEDIDEDVEYSDDELQEKLAEEYAIGTVLGQELRNAGITADDLMKLAERNDPAEAEEFGQFLAHLAEQIFADTE